MITDSEALKYIGERFKVYRKANGYSREEAAKLLHISKRTIAAYERGERGILKNTAIDMANLYKTNVNTLTDYMTLYNINTDKEETDDDR